jgi:hypothetical protein
MFVVGGNGTNTLAYSTNGITWTPVVSPPITTTVWSIAWNIDRFVAVGAGTNTIAYSFDGINWVGSGNILFTTVGRKIITLGNKQGFPLIESQLITDNRQIEVVSDFYQKGFKNISVSFRNKNII